jgi:hypothetical protein
MTKKKQVMEDAATKDKQSFDDELAVLRQEISVKDETIQTIKLFAEKREMLGRAKGIYDGLDILLNSLPHPLDNR